MRVRSWLSTVSVLVAIAALAGCNGATSTVPVSANPTVVVTDKGPVQGALSAGGLLSLSDSGGPPTGANRFAPPQPAATWSPAVKDATKAGNARPQFGPPTAPFGLDQQTSEDCLTLNVTYRCQRPAARR